MRGVGVGVSVGGGVDGWGDDEGGGAVVEGRLQMTIVTNSLMIAAACAVT